MNGIPPTRDLSSTTNLSRHMVQVVLLGKESFPGTCTIGIKTTMRACDRQALDNRDTGADEIRKGERETDEAHFGGPRKERRGNKRETWPIEFGMPERGGEVSAGDRPGRLCSELLHDRNGEESGERLFRGYRKVGGLRHRPYGDAHRSVKREWRWNTTGRKILFDVLVGSMPDGGALVGKVK